MGTGTMGFMKCGSRQQKPEGAAFCNQSRREESFCCCPRNMTRYMTKEGYLAIATEIDRMWTEERPMVVREVADAAELGDRSENGAYIYGKKRLRSIDARLEHLRKRLDKVVVVDVTQQPPSTQVRFGAIVTVEDEDGKQSTWRLVDADESDTHRGRISVQSPVGRALLGRHEGDTASVEAPKGQMELEILSVRYGGGPP